MPTAKMATIEVLLSFQGICETVTRFAFFNDHGDLD